MVSPARSHGLYAESCAFRDLAAEYARIGYTIIGLSTQSTLAQQEAAERLHLPYPILSDPSMELARLLGLRRFTLEGANLYMRCTLVVQNGVIVRAERNIADPSSHPGELLATLQPPR